MTYSKNNCYDHYNYDCSYDKSYKSGCSGSSSHSYSSCSYDYNDCDIAQIGDCFVMEAEDFDQYNFYSTCSSSASEGEIVKLCSSHGTLTETFTGETAVYDLSIYAQDESDGESTLNVYVDGELLTTIVLDGNNNGGGSDNGSFSEISLGTIEVPSGAEISIEAWRDGGEYVRLDKLCLTKVGDVTPPSDDCDETVTVVEDFNGLRDLDDSALIKYDDHWQAHDGAAYADGYSDGTLKFETVTVTGETTISFDVKTYDVDPFESNDEFTVKAAIDGEWVVLDVFTRQGNEFVGSKTGQTYGESLSTLSYTVGDANTSEIQFKVVADFSYCDETVLVDNVAFTSPGDCDEPDDSCGQTVEVCEDFDDVCDLDDADLVESDGNWKAKNDKAYADGYNDGALKFETVEVNGETTISFDIKTKDIDPFESSDEFTVKVAIDGEWEVLDVFTRQGNEFVGSKTGQTYGESFTNLTYTVGDADTSEIQFKVVADFSYCDETVIIDNVCFTSTPECQDCEDTKETFDAAATGATVFDLFDGFTVSAQRSGDDASSENDAMIFDSANPTGGDGDLGFNGKGKIIIISEDNDSSDPDDNAGGGTITFTFDNPSKVTSLELLDIEENGGSIDLFDINGDLIKSVAIPGLYNNSAQTIAIDAEGVASMDVNLAGSGAINDLCFEAGPVIDTGTAEIRGRYFCDENDNDIDDAEPAIVGATVELLDATGNVIATTTTDANGDYEFTGLDAGTYSVRFAADVDGKTFVAQDDPNGNGDDTTDSDVDPSTGETGPIVLAIGEVSEDNDAGVEDPGTASLSGRYFCDENDNDIDDAEPAIVGATVELLDATGNVIDTTTTDANGDYEFTGLDAGTYSVRFAADVDGKTFVAQDDPNGNGDDTTDSDVDPSTGETGPIVLAIGEVSEDNDAGVEDPGTASLSGRYFCDENDNDIDDAEPAIVGATVELLDATGNVIATTTTDANGDYEFTGLDAGTYSVRFAADVDGKTFVAQDDPNGNGDDTTDSDVDPSTGETGPIVLAIGEVSEDNDAGVEDPGTAELGNFVFFDENGNGIFDGADTAVADVEVKLLDENGVQVGATQSTDQNGNYLFTGLNAGMYQVMFTAPAGLAFTLESAAADDAVNNDSDASVLNGMTDLIELSIGESELDIDAGLIIPNVPPVANDDEGMSCADVAVTVDVLANDTDTNGDVPFVSQLGGSGIIDGQTILLSGTATVTDRDGIETVEAFSGLSATLSSAGITFDATNAFSELEIGETAELSVSYAISDDDGATATADIDLKFCGALNTIESIGAYLDGGEVTYELPAITNPFVNFIHGYTMDLQSSTVSEIPLGTYEAAYCIDVRADLEFGTLTTATASVATEESAIAAGVQNAELIDEVVWILNQDFTSEDNGDGNGLNYTDLEIQEAIWVLMNDSTGRFIGTVLPDNNNGVRDGSELGTMENAYEIAQMALDAPGTEEFVPQSGDLVGIILDPTAPVSQDQPFIIAVSYDELAQDCICV